VEIISSEVKGSNSVLNCLIVKPLFLSIADNVLNAYTIPSCFRGLIACGCCFREKYVEAYLDYVFNTSVQAQFKAFNEGFHKVCGGRVLVSGGFKRVIKRMTKTTSR
jgi:hypothetical protein